MVTIMTETELEQYYDAQDEEQVRKQSRLTRIRALEKLNATLAAEIDRMRPVVEAAQVLVRSLRRRNPASWSGTEEALERAVTDYEADKGENQ